MVFIDHPGLKSTVQDGGGYSSQQSAQHQDVEVVEVLSNQNYNVVNLNMFIVTPMPSEILEDMKSEHFI